MRRLALFLAACVAVVSAIGLWAQEADSVVPAINPPVASQSVPRLIMFSGTVKDLTGKPLTGPVELNFAIYKEQTDAAPLWQESQTLNVDEQGHYTALLGAMQTEGLPVELFTTGEARWLGVSAGKLPEQPRVLLVSVPYALKANDAEMLGGKPASAYALAQPAGASTSAGAVTAGTTGPGGAATSELATPKPKSGPKPNATGTGTQYYIPLWTDSAGTLGDSVMYQRGSNVGIGTTTPAYLLDVVGGAARIANPSGTTQLQVSGSATSGRLGQDAAGFFFSSDTNGAAVRFLTNNGGLNEWMRITSGGSVGIGTATPAYLLDVVGGAARIANPSGTTQLQVSGSATSGRLGQDAAGFFFSSDTNGAALRFLTNNGGLNEWMRISSAGNVGIGTATPAHALDVAGDINASTNINAGGNLSVTGTLTGNGSGLTNLNASGLGSGTVPSSALSGTYSNAVTLSNASNSFTGTLNGTATNATELGGAAAANYALLSAANTFTGTQTVAGSLCVSGTVNGMTIVPSTTKSCTWNGTTYACQSANIASGFTNGGSTTTACTDPASSTTSAVLRANPVKSGLAGGKGLRPEAAAPRSTTGLVPETAATFSCPAGGNCIADNVVGGAISGGGGIIGGSAYANTVSNHWGTVAGGASNKAGDGTDPTTTTNCCETVGGGSSNTASGAGATVAGGSSNNATNDSATVAGGYVNNASGSYSTVAGGRGNTASGKYSFAAGWCARAVNDGAFVWNGSPQLSPSVPSCSAVITSSAVRQFVVNAPGGFWLGYETGNTTATQPAGDFLYTDTGAVLTTSGAWTNASDRNLKTAFEPLDESSLLARIGRLPITSWQYRVDPSSIRHIGPVAQDFYSAFRLGNDDKHISTVDEGGVALAGVQALYRLSLEKDAQIRKLTAEVNRLKNVERQMATLEARFARMEAATAKPQPRSIKRAAPAKPAPRSMTLAKAQF